MRTSSERVRRFRQRKETELGRKGYMEYQRENQRRYRLKKALKDQKRGRI